MSWTPRDPIGRGSIKINESKPRKQVRGTKRKEKEQSGSQRKREREEGKCLFFPVDPLPLLHRPPRPLPLWAARWPRLGTDGPPSFLHAGPAGPSKHEAAVVGGHQPDVVQRKDRQASVWRRTRTFHTMHKENRAQPSELKEVLYKKTKQNRF